MASFNGFNFGQTMPTTAYSGNSASQQGTPMPQQGPFLTNEQATPIPQQVPFNNNQQTSPTTQQQQQQHQVPGLLPPTPFPVLVPLEREIPFRIMMLRYPEWSPLDRARVFVRMFSVDLRAQLNLINLPAMTDMTDDGLAAYIQAPLHAEWSGFELSWHQWRKEMVWRMDGATSATFMEEEREVGAHARALGLIVGRVRERKVKE